MQNATPVSAVKLREQKFAAGDATLNAALAGDAGVPMVLLHGVTRNWSDYQGLLPALAQSHRVIAVDHRGHGGSSHGHPDYRVCDFVEDTVAFLQAHVAEPAVLIGHSLGAMTAAMVAARVPDLVRSLVLEDPPGTLLHTGLKDSRHHMQFTGVRRLLATPRPAHELAGALADLPVQHPADGRVVKFREIRDEAALRFAAECLVKADPRILDAIVEGRWLDGLDWFAELKRIQCRTLLLRADMSFGGMLRETEAVLIETNISQCQRVNFHGCGHGIHSTEPARFLDEVTRFLTL
jgi:pimeloyl-ACP methyl ester carboxylesterase